MRTWFLPPPYTDEDLDWIEKSNLFCKVERPYVTYANDSGWCDYETGQEVITDNHKIYIKTETEKEEMWLKLRYIDRVQLQTVLNTPKGDYIFTGENYDN